jgi:hypothetical protein
MLVPLALTPALTLAHTLEQVLEEPVFTAQLTTPTPLLGLTLPTSPTRLIPESTAT